MCLGEVILWLSEEILDQRMSLLVTLLLGRFEPPFRLPAVFLGMAIPCTPQLVTLFSVGTSGHPCQLLHRIVCHSQLGPLVRECLPWESGSLDILSQYVMWSLAQWWQGAQLWCIQCDIIGAIIRSCLMTMTGVGHFHMPLWAGLVWMMLCDTIHFTYLLSSLCEFVSKLPLKVGWKVLRTTFLFLWPLWLSFIAEQKIRGGYLSGIEEDIFFSRRVPLTGGTLDSPRSHKVPWISRACNHPLPNFSVWETDGTFYSAYCPSQ